MKLFNNFKDTIFMKESFTLQYKLEALNRLISEFPNNDNLKEELYIVKKGLEGEKEIEYQLKKSNLGLIVLHDINIEYEDMKAQIDYVVLTKAYSYFIECKNLVGNITINDKGDFIREYSYKNRRIKIGMYSPLRQVEAQRDVFKKIWNNSLNKNKILNNLIRMISEENFKKYHRVLVVAANNETILNTNYAPKDMKYKVIKSDQLIRTLEYDLEHSDKNIWDSKKNMIERANFYLCINNNENINYYDYYKNKYCNNDYINKDALKKELLDFRKKRSRDMNVPAYYVFTNEELNKIIELIPNTIEELKNLNILTPVKIKTHGSQIISIINNINREK